jgi:predicted nucleic acid-binding protein
MPSGRRHRGLSRMIRELLEEDRVATCGPVIFELMRGLKPKETKNVLTLFDALHRLSFDEGDWQKAGELDASYRRVVA